MKSQTKRMLGIITIIATGTVTITGCSRQADTPPTEPSGVVEQTKDAAVSAGEATKDMSGRAMERTGEALENAGDAMQEK